MNTNINDYIEKEYKKIYKSHWNFMKNDYIYYADVKHHRKKIEKVKKIEKIKENVYEKLGDIPVYVFLTDLCNNIKLPGPYIMLEKALLLIQNLLTGYTFSEMEIYIPETSFYRLYQSLYIKNYEYLEKWIDNKLKYCFSSPLLRLLCAKKFNPNLLDNVTLFLDGHHNRIEYQDINLDKKELYSWKLKRNGSNTQIIIDVNKMCIFVSDSLPCKNNNDDKMFLNINVDNFYNETDCICFDGLYENTVQEYIEKYKNIGYNISLHNFCYPIRKDKNIKLTDDETNFNEILSGFRSTIETYFADLGNIFKKFNGQHKVRVTDKKIYNIQLKLAIVLLNIKHFTNLFGIESNNHYGKWKLEDYNYVIYNKNNMDNYDNLSKKTEYKIDKINTIKEIQSSFLNNLVINEKNNDDNTILRDEDENMVVEEDTSNSSYEKPYEIQYIIKHKKLYNKYEYLVKWKNYSKDYNSWVKEADFIEKDIINEYWKSIKRC